MLKIFTVLVLLVSPLIGQNAWINEFHYDNTGPDEGEFIEIAIENSGSYVLADFTMNFYNGGSGNIYNTETLNNFTAGSTINNTTFYYLELPVNGFHNGAPDGFSLDYQGALIQFLSYEGTFVATEGIANGHTSIDIGVSETTAVVGESLQLQGTGSEYSDFVWTVTPIGNTKGNINIGQRFPTNINAWINEFHYDNTGPDEGEFIEIAIENSGSYVLADFTMNFYNGGSGNIYNTETLNNFTAGSTINNTTFYYLELPVNGFHNGAPDGFSLDYQGALIQFLSYEGTFVATEGVANGHTSIDIGVSETTVAVGESLQLQGTGSQYSDFVWTVTPIVNTKGNINSGQTINISNSILLDITIFLEGPYNSSNMNASLAVPFDSPYTANSETVNPIPNISGNEVVDWVMIELRDGSNSSSVIESQSAFVLQNGSVVDIDGISHVHFNSPSGVNYYVTVKHRNHLSVMSASAIGL